MKACRVRILYEGRDEVKFFPVLKEKLERVRIWVHMEKDNVMFVLRIDRVRIFM